MDIPTDQLLGGAVGCCDAGTLAILVGLVGSWEEYVSIHTLYICELFEVSAPRAFITLRTGLGEQNEMQQNRKCMLRLSLKSAGPIWLDWCSFHTVSKSGMAIKRAMHTPYAFGTAACIFPLYWRTLRYIEFIFNYHCKNNYTQNSKLQHRDAAEKDKNIKQHHRAFNWRWTSRSTRI